MAAARVTDTAHWRLNDRREFLQRSLEDARREHDAGDLTDADYDALRRRDEELLAEVEASLAVESQGIVGTRADEGADGGASDAPVVATRDSDVPGVAVATRLWRLRRRWWFVATGLVLVGAGAFLLVHALTAPLLPGETETGTIDLNTAQRIEQQLAQAKTLLRSGNQSEALKVYGDVLSEDPRQPLALTEWGWLDWEAASKVKEQTIAAEGASALEEAVRVDKKLFAAQYYLGTVLMQEGSPKKAVPHFAQFLADKPTASWLREAAPEIRAAYGAAHVTLPAGVPGG